GRTRADSGLRGSRPPPPVRPLTFRALPPLAGGGGCGAGRGSDSERRPRARPPPAPPPARGSPCLDGSFPIAPPGPRS
ncbi:hypothetical protein P7K49_004349, partial [Saguinus oedipus]